MSMVRNIPVAFKSGELQLEGIISEGSNDKPFSIVLCSPEPHLGGNMDSSVVKRLALDLVTAGYFCFRFNYRGVGSSEGTIDMGQGQVSDAGSAVQLMENWPTSDAKKLILIGYSYGAGVALRLGLSQANSFAAIVLISPHMKLPPLGLELVSEAGNINTPMMVISGDKDLSASPDSISDWIESLSNKLVTSNIVVDGDRSWRGKEGQLSVEIIEYINKIVL